MNYATHRHIRDYNPKQKTRTKGFTPSTLGVLPMDAKNKRCPGNTKRQAPTCSTPPITDGFLRTSFMPKVMLGGLKPLTCDSKIENGFYASLWMLSKHYGIILRETSHFDYPYNIALALSDMKEKLRQTTPNYDNHCIVQDKQKTYIIIEERYKTGTTLYYIPMIPLYCLLKDPNKLKAGHLLLSVCSYLYLLAGVPYYRQENSYLYWQYEMHLDMLEQDEEIEETFSNRQELNTAKCIGDSMEQKLYNKANLEHFKKRLTAFTIHNEFDQECYKLASNTLALYHDYPNETIFRNAPQDDFEMEDDDDFENITMDKYISFVADTKGWLYESIAEGINSEFNEFGGLQEPCIKKVFDGTLITESLDFENRVFNVIEELCYLLTNYKTFQK